ncbi:HPr kinase/phosphatase C-terminal domain-containing protein [Sphingomonas corticis]|uniref:Aldolase n=1 Tax=Sphingomonas corticis TaxID=2722791 RepID=A0ABX1CH30_9SPHN|nr:aldolase [Sphingomonas corticis]
MTAPVHATCVAIGGRGVLILGESGAGKSDLAMRLIDRGARLVSDDYTRLENDAGALVASAPGTIAGKMEVRGLGIVTMPYQDRATIALAVRLGVEERMPDAATLTLAGVAVPQVTIDPRAPSAPIKVEWAMEQMAR